MHNLMPTVALLLLGAAAPAATSRARQDARLQQRVATVGLLAVARDPGLSARERSMLRLMAAVNKDVAALQVLGPEPQGTAPSRFSIRPGTRFERRTVAEPARE